jgi:hypothetical protein
LAVFWGTIALSLFSESGALDTEKLIPAFRGSLELPLDLGWVYSVPGLFAQLLTNAVRLGISCVYLASALMAPDLSQPDHLDRAAAWFDEVETEVLLCPIGSPEFEEAFFHGTMPILSLEPSGGDGNQSSLMRFAPAEKKWSVFKFDHEFMRALWQSDLRNVLFYSRGSDRTSLLPNPNLFTHLTVQLCDPPIGDPALVSPFLELLINPWTL